MDNISEQGAVQGRLSKLDSTRYIRSMPRKPEFIMPSDEEDALINQGISQDASNPELTTDDFLNAEPASVAVPELAA
ncbi:hypothetical protein CPF11_03255 [Acetobacter pomorum]|nr:hypothetical protein CPF11_03255 [Acetobacter pomorum]